MNGRRYLYYPGCSLKGTGRHYEESFLALFEALGRSVREIDDWNCCGATAYMSIDEPTAFGLAARNLSLAEAQSGDEAPCIVAPCSACYLVLAKAKRYMAEYPALGDRVRGGGAHGRRAGIRGARGDPAPPSMSWSTTSAGRRFGSGRRGRSQGSGSRPTTAASSSARTPTSTTRTIP